MTEKLRLPVRTHVVVADGGAQSVRLTVFCPSRASATDVHTCLACPRRDATVDLDRSEMAAIHCSPDALQCDALVGEHVAYRSASVRADLPVERVATVLARPDVDAAPVVDADGRLLGVVTPYELDACRREPLIRYLAKLRGTLRGVRARDIMTRVATLPETAPLVDGIRRMALARARRLPVVDADGVVVGLAEDVTLLRGYARRAR